MDYSGITRETLEEHMTALSTKRDEVKRNVDRARGAEKQLTKQIEEARNNGTPVAEIAATLGVKFGEARVELEKALIEYGALEAQITNDLFWITRLEKHMIAGGKGQQVMALTDMKLR